MERQPKCGDSWIYPAKDINPLGPIQLQDQNVLVADLLSRETKEWNKHLIEDTLPLLANQFISIRPSTLGAHDSFVWTQHPSGIYSAKSGYYSSQQAKIHSTSVLMENTTSNQDKNIWTPPLLPKLKHFLWKCARNVLPTGDNLHRRNITTDTLCLRCDDQESLLHLLFHCPFASEVWDLVPWSSLFDSTTSVSFKEELASSHKQIILPPVGVTSNLFPWVVWNIQTSRNQLLFDKRASTLQEVLIKATIACREWDGAQSNLIKLAQDKPLHLPPPQPSSDIVVCYTDAAWNSTCRAADVAWIFTDRHGTQISRGSCYQDNVSSPFLAEALAIRCALIHASSLNQDQIWLHSDSQGLVTAINKNRRSIELFGVLAYVESLISTAFSFVYVSFISSRFNGPADQLVKTCLCINFVMGL